MIIKRLLILQVVLAVGLSSVFLLPTKSHSNPAGISLELPKEVGGWTSREAVISEDELKVLSTDTGFSRRIYTNAFGDEVMVGIVLSGEDMANSIHRPERCLPAQGWTVVRSERIKVPMAGKPPLEVTKLTNLAERRTADGRVITLRNLNYYWFVGSRDVTPSHFARTMLDIKDRVLQGENQRWAYVTVAATITENLKRFGRSEKETAQLIEGLVSEIVPQFKRPAEAATRS
jgi:EpsI family protein